MGLVDHLHATPESTDTPTISTQPTKPPPIRPTNSWSYRTYSHDCNEEAEFERLLDTLWPLS